MSTPYSQLIHRYLDGELPTDLERSLFDELAGNEELRREFGVELELHKAATADMASIIPPENIRASVFSRLDIPAVSEEPVIIAPTSSTTRFLSFGAVALLSMIVGASAVWFGISRNYLDRPELTIAQRAATVQNQSYNQSALTSPSPSNEITANATHSSRRLYSNSRFSNNSMNSSVGNSLNAPSGTTLFDEIKRQAEAIANNEHLTSNNHNTVAIQHAPEIQSSLSSSAAISSPRSYSMLENEKQTQDVPFYVQVQGISSIAGSRGSGAYSIAAMYELDAENSLGIEVCDDNFTRVETRNELGVIIPKNTKEQFIAIGASYHLSLPSISYGQVVPFIQSFAGATINGSPVTRASVGFEWTPDSRVTVSGGIDASAIGYRTNGAWKATSSLGLIYGVSVLL